VWCEKQAAACSVTASVVNYLYFAVIGMWGYTPVRTTGVLLFHFVSEPCRPKAWRNWTPLFDRGIWILHGNFLWQFLSYGQTQNRRTAMLNVRLLYGAGPSQNNYFIARMQLSKTLTRPITIWPQNHTELNVWHNQWLRRKTSSSCTAVL